MDLKTAERIMHDFGKFTEIAHGNLLLFFLGEIPECLLPYQKKTIEEALQIMEVYYHSSSDHETVGLLQAVKSNLLFYGADEKAIDSELKRLKNIETKNKLIDGLKQGQDEAFGKIKTDETP